ncbi:hypothetical protein ACFFKE_02955 [Streptomyces mutabilis]|uniref:hypothetical protein n=1 Tax=Streptomyces mutabilis TaxID=67332 RepID=UPI00177FE88E|nr:hypothetical protein [Streptomyces mutabilis]
MSRSIFSRHSSGVPATERRSATPVKAFTGRDLPEAADVDTRLRLIAERLVPAFE